MKFKKGIVANHILQSFYDDLLEKVSEKDALEIVNDFQQDETESFNLRLKQISERIGIKKGE